jgi:molybdenum cofactor synthesis domain-containing protein
MLSVDQAIDVVLANCAPPDPTSAVACPLLDSIGAVLAEDVLSDVDLPPFTRSTMDGFALQSTDARAGARLKVIGEAAAGTADPGSVRAGCAVRIFTGAPLPAGADAVIMVEQTACDGDVVTLQAAATPGQNLARAGEDLRRGAVAAPRGTAITTAHVGLLASAGATSLKVLPRPRVAILATGSELVPPDRKPRAGQIRESNGAQTAALVRQAGGVPVPLGIVADDAAAIRDATRAALDADLVVLSGGSSVGAYDFTPAVLADLGVTVHFDRVALKPGKPTLFGTRGKTSVFGMPGNPISAFVVFHLFVRPALAKRAGVPDARPRWFPARLEAPVKRVGARDQLLPAVLEPGPADWSVRFAGWHGSGDVTSIGRANALVLVPRGDGELATGAAVRALPIDAGGAQAVGLALR